MARSLAGIFCKLPREYDSLNHAVNRIKKAQQYGNRKTPRLWARVKGINDDISVKTAHFIIDVALRYHADVIVFEHLDLSHKKGKQKQSLHLWKSRYVQSMVTGKAHRQGIQIAHVNAWGTSRFAFDGSGTVARGKEAGFSLIVCVDSKTEKHIIVISLPLIISVAGILSERS